MSTLYVVYTTHIILVIYIDDQNRCPINTIYDMYKQILYIRILFYMLFTILKLCTQSHLTSSIEYIRTTAYIIYEIYNLYHTVRYIQYTAYNTLQTNTLYTDILYLLFVIRFYYVPHTIFYLYMRNILYTIYNQLHTKYYILYTMAMLYTRTHILVCIVGGLCIMYEQGFSCMATLENIDKYSYHAHV